MTKVTSKQIASNWHLWNEYVNPSGAMSHEEFEALTVEERLEIMEEIWPGENEDDITQD